MPAPTLYGKGDLPREVSRRQFRPLRGGNLCLDFVNTVSDHEAPPGDDDLSPGYVNVIDWCRHAGLFGEDEAARLPRTAGKEPREAAAVRKRVVTLRESLYEILVALTSGREPEAKSLDVLNQEHRDALGQGQFVPAGPNLQWHWPTGPNLDRLLWPICQSAALLLSGDQLARVKQCEAPACQAFFLDGSKNGSRRFCSAATCGTADRVRRFRERRKPGS